MLLTMVRKANLVNSEIKSASVAQESVVCTLAKIVDIFKKLYS
jgi:hypothetical protein